MSNTARNMKYTEQGFLMLRLHFSLDFVDVRFEGKTETISTVAIMSLGVRAGREEKPLLASVTDKSMSF